MCFNQSSSIIFNNNIFWFSTASSVSSTKQCPAAAKVEGCYVDTEWVPASVNSETLVHSCLEAVETHPRLPQLCRVSARCATVWYVELKPRLHPKAHPNITSFHFIFLCLKMCLHFMSLCLFSHVVSCFLIFSLFLWGSSFSAVLTPINTSLSPMSSFHVIVQCFYYPAGLLHVDLR